MGAVATIRRDFEQGRALCEEALALQRELRNDEGAALALQNIARIHLRCKRLDEAGEHFWESVETARKLGYREILAYCLQGFAEIAAARAGAARAARLLGASDTLFEELGVSRLGDERETYEETVEHLRKSLGRDRFESEYAAGAGLPVEDAFELAGEPSEAEVR
jgi:tetratricopeptide (TPR) repeat protein